MKTAVGCKPCLESYCDLLSPARGSVGGEGTSSWSIAGPAVPTATDRSSALALAGSASDEPPGAITCPGEGHVCCSVGVELAGSKSQGCASQVTRRQHCSDNHRVCMAMRLMHPNP
jgi:hypothetical protein